LRPRWATPMLVVPCLVWAALIAIHFLLLSSALAKLVYSSSARVMLLLRNRLSLSRRRHSVCLMCCRRAILRCRGCSRGSGGNVVLPSSICIGDRLMRGGSLGWENMANALCNVGLSLGFGNCLVFPLPVTVIHLSSSFSPSSDVPAHRYLLSESFFSAYPPKSAKNLMRGLNSTSSSSQIDLKRYPLYFLFHMHLSGSTQWGFLR
jgi:hypothetical protein